VEWSKEIGDLQNQQIAVSLIFYKQGSTIRISGQRLLSAKIKSLSR